MITIQCNSTVPEEAKPRLGLQHQAIIERLQKGPVTNYELLQYAQRFGARIHELRKAGYNIIKTYADDTRGVYVYSLEGGQSMNSNYEQAVA